MTTTSYVPNTGSARAGCGTVAAFFVGRAPVNSSHTSPTVAVAADGCAPASATPVGVGSVLASAAAALPTRAPKSISATGRNSFSA